MILTRLLFLVNLTLVQCLPPPDSDVVGSVMEPRVVIVSMVGSSIGDEAILLIVLI